MLRQIQMRQCQKEKIEWIKLVWNPKSTMSHVESEFQRGFVSLEYLKNLDNSYGTGIKLRTKHITFVSHEASLLQKHKYLSFGQSQDAEMVSEYSMAENPCAKCLKKDSQQMLTCSECSKCWH